MDHAPNPEYIDANHGGVVIVLDRLFGTFVAERNDLSCRYGLTTPLLTNNPIGIAFHEWLELLEGLRKLRSWREAIGGLFGPPGWQPRFPSAW